MHDAFNFIQQIFKLMEMKQFIRDMRIDQFYLSKDLINTINMIWQISNLQQQESHSGNMMIDFYYHPASTKTPSLLNSSEARTIANTLSELVKLNNPSNQGMVQILRSAVTRIQKQSDQAYLHLKSLNYQVTTQLLIELCKEFTFSHPQLVRFNRIKSLNIHVIVQQLQHTFGQNQLSQSEFRFSRNIDAPREEQQFRIKTQADNIQHDRQIEKMQQIISEKDQEINILRQHIHYLNKQGISNELDYSIQSSSRLSSHRNSQFEDEESRYKHNYMESKRNPLGTIKSKITLSRLDQLEGQNRKQRQQISNYEAKNNYFQADLKKMKKNEQRQEEKIRELEQEITLIRKQLNNTFNANVMIEDRTKELQRQIDAQRVSLNSKDRQIEEIFKEFDIAYKSVSKVWRMLDRK